MFEGTGPSAATDWSGIGKQETQVSAYELVMGH